MNHFDPMTDRFGGAFSSGANRRSSSPGSGAFGQNSSKGPSPTTSPPQQSLSPPSTHPEGGAGGSSSGLNPRSCVTCRRRKVKCDKRNPCSNCVKQHIECVFPRPGRAPRKTKKPQDAELLARLRRLEGVVQKLGRGDMVDADGSGAAASASAASPEDDRRSSTATDIPEDTSSQPTPKEPPRFIARGGPSTGGRLKIEKEMGKLVVGEGKSRYVSNTFWATLTDEMAEMRDLIDSSDDSVDDETPSAALSPESQDSGLSGRQTHQEFLFGYSSTLQTLRILHPPAKQVMTYWEIYVQNVDPIVRILHKPTTQHLFATIARDPSELSKSTEALVFAVYFSVVTSMSPEACQSRLGIDRETASRRYRFAVEQALARASFLACQELIVVQAFTLFLACVRRHDSNRIVWTMTGLLDRMAIGIGLHRDGTNFDLAPFQTEMRRRLWWQVCTIDVRASEDQGADPMVANIFFDTRMPLNVNDDDIWPDMKEPPIEHEKCTEMTFDLVRYEIGSTIRTLAAAESASQLPEKQHSASLEAKEALLEKLRHRLEDKYLRHCDMSVPLQWVAANVARLVMGKIWLVIHHPFRQPNYGAQASQETRDRTFLTSIDVIRYSRMLWTQHRTNNWGWLFRTYFQWHAVAFLLSELCVRTTGEAVDEAWDVLTEALPDWESESDLQRRSILWKPIQKLIAKARRVRLEELARRRVFPTDGTLGVAPKWQQQLQLQQQMQRSQQLQTPPPSLSMGAHPSPSGNNNNNNNNSLLTASTNGAGAGSGSAATATPSPNPLGSGQNGLGSLGSGFGGVGAGTNSNTVGGAAAVNMGIDAGMNDDFLGIPNRPQNDTAMQDLDASGAGDVPMGLWLNDSLLLDNETWDANQTPWMNVGLDPEMAFANDDGVPMDFNQRLWSQSGIGGTGF